jgi:hypothetical protein
MLPPDEPPLVPGAAPLVVQSRDEVLAILPARYKSAISAPIRDALADSLLALLKECQYRGSYAAAQRDIGRATGEYLDGQVEDYSRARAQNEQDEPLRTRVLSTTSGVSFDSIRDAVNLVLSPFTSIECQIIDGILDRWFLGRGGSRNWHSFMGKTPSYPSRLYQHDAPQNDGIAKRGNDPGGPRIFRDTVGRMFYVRVPDLTPLNSSRVLIYGPTVTQPQRRGGGWFLGSGASPVNTSFIGSGATALSVYIAIKNTVQTLIGHSIRWVMVSDRKLV